jgi:hypothetical protein
MLEDCGCGWLVGAREMDAEKQLNRKRLWAAGKQVAVDPNNLMPAAHRVASSREGERK